MQHRVPNTAKVFIHPEPQIFILPFELKFSQNLNIFEYISKQYIRHDAYTFNYKATVKNGIQVIYMPFLENYCALSCTSNR